MSARYRVLSLDLHDTVVWDTREIVEAQYDVRWNLLARGLRMPNGGEVAPEVLRMTREALYSEWKSQGPPVETVPVANLVDQIRQRLGAQFVSPVEQLVRSFDEGGLKEHPPMVNPEAQDLVRFLNEVGFPVIMITDTSRSGSAWKSFLSEVGGMQLTHVIASSDVGACKPDGRVFSEAVRRCGVSASEVLHVGDSWKWDVEGALGFGMGAALYRGLRAHYWDPDEARYDAPTPNPSVPRLDHLSEIRILLDLA